MRSIKSDQKDIGKLKGNNERLKTEMASLKAMLQAQAAQAQGDKGREESERVVQQKQMQIGILEARIKQLEKELDNEKSNSNGLEKEVKAQKVQVQKLLEDMQKLRKQKQEEIQNLRKQQRAIPSVQTTSDVEKRHPQAPAMQTPFSLNELAEHQAMVAKLDEELETERRFRREADGEILKLRAQMSGVTLEDSDVDALIPKNIDQTEARTEGKDSERQGDRYVLVFIPVSLPTQKDVEKPLTSAVFRDRVISQIDNCSLDIDCIGFGPCLVLCCIAVL